MKEEYIFKSKRLGFRNWTKDDVTELSKINADLEVMKYFPKPLTEKETSGLINRLKNQYIKNGYSYFATEILNSGELIGFIGLAFQDYKTDFTPAVDIGWRLKKTAWGKGYATEGAKKCLQIAFNELNLDSIISTCTEENSTSENVMRKIGMKKVREFNHPKLKEYPEYERCICYEINKNMWQNYE